MRIVPWFAPQTADPYQCQHAETSVEMKGSNFGAADDNFYRVHQVFSDPDSRNISFDSSFHNRHNVQGSQTPNCDIDSISIRSMPPVNDENAVEVDIIVEFGTVLGAKRSISRLTGENIKDAIRMHRVDAPPYICLLYTSPSPRDQRGSRMPSSA